MTSADAKSGGALERVVIDGERYVVKHLHVDDDWIMRATGDVTCRALLVWQSGLFDELPACFDTAMVGAAGGLGRNGWGCARCSMHDRSSWLLPEGGVVPLDQHLRFLDHMAELHASFWEWEDTIGLMPYSNRWTLFSSHLPVIEAARGGSDAVPRIAAQGWQQFAERAGDVVPLVLSLRDDPSPLSSRLDRTPSTLVHGDWKLANLGTGPDGQTLLIDWALPGRGPAAAELGVVPLPQRSAASAVEGGRDRHVRSQRSRARASISADGGSHSSRSHCWARSCSSDGRRRSATTTSSSGGSTERAGLVPSSSDPVV